TWPVLYGLADQVVVSSNAARALIMSLGVPAEDVTLTPLVVDNDWWYARSREVDRAAVRSSWGAAPDTQVVLFCGKLQIWKRPLDLLHAFAAINDAQSMVVIAGEGPQREELQAEAARLGIADRVRMLGFVNQSDLPAVYTSADLLVLPSAFEPFAAVVAEASCCGCPVMASDCVGAAPDLIAPVNPQFIFPAGNVDALTVALRRAISSKSALAEFGRKARARMDTWSYRENIDGTIRAIARAVRKVRYSPLTPDSSLDVSPPHGGESPIHK
ncbi:MAG: glycosyltransferase family 4 protein, partial [Acidobacteriota bacterium]|nr:glycosyltransferase family 4 protein [Acidobacteriota bacterium]